MTNITNKNENNNRYNGFGFMRLLTLLFITLKLTNYIDWSWWWVLSPFLLSVTIQITFILVVVVLGVYFFNKDKQ